ncbi:hypothetical protein FNH22_26900 [Fulvivirga sp. M361]|uniref:PD40 domain-containing protein n=1 Tax=Fulvivirga sp. M361 TaxID=2594266 RepID=UPI001179EFA9|nr:PD40 domain-containing protein [Fulvivirga sp. M361]TRX49698.1 hypothetical protein FNH22_26900 [Fulvivirga sp. M361]
MKTSGVVFFLVVAFFCPELCAQGDQAKLKRKRDDAEQLFDQFEYFKAIELYEEIASVQDDPFIYMKTALSYYKVGDLQSAEEWYRKATVAELPVEEQFNFAEVLMGNGKYEEARKWYELYSQNAPHDNRTKKKLAFMDQMAVYHKNETGYEVHIIDINSIYADFGSAFYEGGIIFASAREEVAQGKRYGRTNSAYLDIYLSEYTNDSILGTPKKFSKVVNTKYHEGPAVIYDSGNQMIFTRNNFHGSASKNEDNTIHLQLFHTSKTEKGLWSKPVLLDLVEDKYSVGHPSVSQDGKQLYFSSNIPGGFGGTDLYVSQFSNETWGAPMNLGNEVNTEGNEMFPFMSEEGVLYFASDGHGGLGGMDVFRTSLMQQRGVENLGKPINSARDDFGFVLHSDGDWGYFSSNRPGGVGDDDIYRFTVKEPEPPEEVIPEEIVVKDTAIVVEYVYTVQILALLNPKTVYIEFLQDLEGVLKHDGRDGFHRYTFGEYTGLDKALETLEIIRSKGYHDAFIRKVARYPELSHGPGRDVRKLLNQ